MIRRFKQFIKSESLFSFKDRILVAVSGGVDSVVLCRLMSDSGYDFGVAHCNFSLRGAESDDDEKFVASLAETFKVPFYNIRFNTGQIAREQGLSIQMAARNLRYSWFDQVCSENGYYCIATAHHLDDQAETFFINLLRGTGIAGLHGILPRQGRVVRPLLFATRNEILDFAGKKGLEWREDSSNINTKYLRNQLRHEVMPSLEKIDSDFARNLDNTIRRLRGTESVYRQKIEEGRSDLLERTEHSDRILISYLLEFEPVETWLFEILRHYGFSEAITRGIASSLEGTESKVFYSMSHRVLRDRDYLVIEKNEKNASQPDSEYLVYDTGHGIVTTAPAPITFRKEPADGFQIPDKQSIACFDYDKLRFPLVLRHWREGDRIVPLGMKGRKKLSDIFIDQKLSQSEKKSIWLLCSGENIMWVAGLRIDGRFRITDHAKNILIAEIIEPEPDPAASSCWLFG
jgi:tRNA(Ile)-lysidine synthase